MTEGACRKELDQGLSVRVLENWDPGVIEVQPVFQAARGGKPAARVQADFLTSELSEAMA